MGWQASLFGRSCQLGLGSLLSLLMVAANPVPSEKANPYLTEEAALAIMRSWVSDGKVGKLAVELDTKNRAYNVGYAYKVLSSEGYFQVWGSGYSLEDALRDVARRQWGPMDRARMQEFLRRK